MPDYIHHTEHINLILFKEVQFIMQGHQFSPLRHTLHDVHQLPVIQKVRDPLPYFHLEGGGLLIYPLLNRHAPTIPKTFADCKAYGSKDSHTFRMYTLSMMIPPSFLSGLDRLCIDASSMIYHLKTGILGSLAAEVHLISTPQVIAEVGWPHLPVTSMALADTPISNDASLLILARREGVPLLSEDREILETAGKEGMEYYNTLMMLNYLLLKKRILPADYPEYLERLKECSRYSQKVLDYGRRVYEEILSFNSQA
jgi:hypothetical protein